MRPGEPISDVEPDWDAWLRLMIRIRTFEMALSELFSTGRLVGAVHLSIGQEAVAVGLCSTLEPADMMTLTHRGHHHMLARGLRPDLILGEILGKETGYCRGKGGSMHVAALGEGVAGANGIVGGGIPHALGLAVAAQYRGTDGIGVAVFGDGAANQGSFHETLNLAAIWNAPVVFVCENNGFTEFSPTESVTSGPGIYQRARAYGIPGDLVDGDDLMAVRRSAQEAVVRARAGGGPTLIECRTTRWRGHHEGEEVYAGAYRDFVQGPDPIDTFQESLARLGLDTTERRALLQREESADIEASVEAALSAAPAPISWAYEDVFAT